MIKIHTEDINRDGITDILDRYFDAYTLIPAIGRWKGHAEQSLIIEIAETGHTPGTHLTQLVWNVAEEIKSLNHQEAVLVTQDHVRSWAL